MVRIKRYIAISVDVTTALDVCVGRRVEVGYTVPSAGARQGRRGGVLVVIAASFSGETCGRGGSAAVWRRSALCGFVEGASVACGRHLGW
jgi:hypothetical protein